MHHACNETLQSTNGVQNIRTCSKPTSQENFLILCHSMQAYDTMYFGTLDMLYEDYLHDTVSFSIAPSRWSKYTTYAQPITHEFNSQFFQRFLKDLCTCHLIEFAKLTYLISNTPSLNLAWSVEWILLWNQSASMTGFCNWISSQTEVIIPQNLYMLHRSGVILHWNSNIKSRFSLRVPTWIWVDSLSGSKHNHNGFSNTD